MGKQSTIRQTHFTMVSSLKVIGHVITCILNRKQTMLIGAPDCVLSTTL